MLGWCVGSCFLGSGFRVVLAEVGWLVCLVSWFLVGAMLFFSGRKGLFRRKWRDSLVKLVLEA